MSKKSQDSNAKVFLTKGTLILAKIAEVLHWCLAGVMLAGTLATIIQPTAFTEWVKTTILHGETNLSCYGLEAAIVNADGVPQPGMMLGFAFGSAIVLALMAMVFRNVYLILKTAQGKTWFAKGNTPFQKNIVRMFREIGIFFIVIAVMGLISEVIVNLAGGEIMAGFNYLDCFMGLVFLCISQFFSYGTGLEKDLDGLV